MKKNTVHIPIACRLSDVEFRRREATLLAQFKALVVREEEVPDGYVFTIPRENESIAALDQLITAERECCPFLEFELIEQSDSGSLTLRVTGPSAAKEFVRNVFCKSRNE